MERMAVARADASLDLRGAVRPALGRIARRDRVQNVRLTSRALDGRRRDLRRRRHVICGYRKKRWYH